MICEPQLEGSDPPLEITERRLSPAYLLISFGRSLISLLPVIAVGIWKAPGWSIGVLAGLLAVRAVAEWWTRRYSVRGGSLRVRSGVFKKSQDTIGIGRITSLDAERGVVQRVLGVWGVKVRTPGNDHRSSLHLPSLTLSALEDLRVALRQPVHAGAGGLPAGLGGLPAGPGGSPDGAGGLPAGAGGSAAGGHADQTQPIGPGGPTTLAVLGTRTLLLAALTGTSIPLMFAGAAAAFGRIRDVLPERVLHRLSGEVFGGGRTTVLILLAAVVAAVIAGIVLTSLRLANFTLVRDGDRLRISRGLLAQRSGTIPVERVQAVRVVQGWWRRMLGYCALEVEVAGISASNDAERMLFPLVRIALAPDLVALALPEMRWQPSPLQPVPAGARRRYFTLPVLLALVVTSGLALLPGWGWYLALAPVPVALLIGWGQAAAAAWAIDEDTVTFRWHRILSRHTVIARRGRVQLTEISRTPFQRRAGLAGTRLLLSSKRRARLRHMEFDDALMLLHAVGRRAHPAGNAVGEARAHMPATYREP